MDHAGLPFPVCVGWQRLEEVGDEGHSFFSSLSVHIQASFFDMNQLIQRSRFCMSESLQSNGHVSSLFHSSNFESSLPRAVDRNYERRRERGKGRVKKNRVSCFALRASNLRFQLAAVPEGQDALPALVGSWPGNPEGGNGNGMLRVEVVNGFNKREILSLAFAIYATKVSNRVQDRISLSLCRQRLGGVSLNKESFSLALLSSSQGCQSKRVPNFFRLFPRSIILCTFSGP